MKTTKTKMEKPVTKTTLLWELYKSKPKLETKKVLKAYYLLVDYLIYTYV